MGSNIIGEAGANKLAGKGAMLFKSDNYESVIDIQGAYMSESEIKKTLEQIDFNFDYDKSHKFVITGFVKEQNSQYTINESKNDHIQSETIDYNQKLADCIICTLSKEDMFHWYNPNCCFISSIILGRFITGFKYITALLFDISTHPRG